VWPIGNAFILFCDLAKKATISAKKAAFSQRNDIVGVVGSGDLGRKYGAE
jgi:hypothetical protein